MHRQRGQPTAGQSRLTSAALILTKERLSVALQPLVRRAISVSPHRVILTYTIFPKFLRVQRGRAIRAQLRFGRVRLISTARHRKMRMLQKLRVLSTHWLMVVCCSVSIHLKVESLKQTIRRGPGSLPNRMVKLSLMAASKMAGRL